MDETNEGNRREITLREMTKMNFNSNNAVLFGRHRFL